MRSLRLHTHSHTHIHTHTHVRLFLKVVKQNIIRCTLGLPQGRGIHTQDTWAVGEVMEMLGWWHLGARDRER